MYVHCTDVKEKDELEALLRDDSSLAEEAVQEKEQCDHQLRDLEVYFLISLSHSRASPCCTCCARHQ